MVLVGLAWDGVALRALHVWQVGVRGMRLGWVVERSVAWCGVVRAVVEWFGVS